MSPEIRSKIVEIRKLPEFSTVNTKHFLEILEENYKIKVSYSFLYNFLKSNGFESSRKHRKAKKHHRRKRRERFGELLQADATSHQFFEGDHKYYALHGFIDDATGQITGLYMCENECMEGYFQITRQTLESLGIPTAIYADGSSIFFSHIKEKLTVEEELMGISQHKTQYQTIMDTLGIELIRAYSSQAKGRVEKLWDTLQNRLITEFKMYKITTVKQANKFFRKFIVRFNKKFAVTAENPNSDFLPLPESVNLDRLLTVKYVRIIDNGGCFSLNNYIFKINNCDIPSKTAVDVLISKKKGVTAVMGDKAYSVTPILDKNKKQVNSTESVNMIIAQFVFANLLKSERVA
jgi:transposase